MKMIVFSLIMLSACGSKADATSCQAVGERLAVLDAGRLANFMTEKDRKSRAKRWVAKCEPMTEAQRKCVLAAATMEDAHTCTGVSAGGVGTVDDRGDHARDVDAASQTKASETAKAKWIFQSTSGSGVVDHLAIASDGDIVAAGRFRKRLVLGETSLEAKDETSVWIARLSPDGAMRWARALVGVHAHHLTITPRGIVVDIQSDTAPQFRRRTIAVDGSKETPGAIGLEMQMKAAVMHRDGAIVSGPISASGCGTFEVHRLGATGKVLWSACDKNPDSSDASKDAEFHHLAVAQDGSIAFCSTYSGAAPMWGAKGPDATGKQAFVSSFTGDGKHRWTQYMNRPEDTECDRLVVTKEGYVLAFIDGVKPAIETWKPDGAPGWMRTCDELLPGESECSLMAMVARDDELVVHVARGTTAVTASVILRLDASTGATMEPRVFDHEALVTVLAANASEIVFGTFLPAGEEQDFGTGVLKARNPQFGSDVVIGKI